MQVPPFRQGGMAPGATTQGSTFSQNCPNRPGGQRHKTVAFGSETHVPIMHVTTEHGLT